MIKAIFEFDVPKSCTACPMFHLETDVVGADWCKASGSDFQRTNPLNGRPSFCPLKIVSESPFSPKVNDFNYEYILLKVEPESLPIYFIVKSNLFDLRQDWDNESYEYYYEEHTCPTNWLCHVEEVIAYGEPDPHGFATFVRRVVPPDGFSTDDVRSESGNFIKTGDRLLDLFPELMEDDDK